MRYYAGNWAFSVWFIRKTKLHCLERKPGVPYKHPKTQLTALYDERTAIGAVESVLAFRSLHLHGRILHDLIPQAVDNLQTYEWMDGEVMCGWLVGWNFGDGHLHDHRLLAAVQEKCTFESGDLRCIFVESQALHRGYQAWNIYDAKDGKIAHGQTAISHLVQRQPWPQDTAKTERQLTGRTTRRDKNTDAE